MQAFSPLTCCLGTPAPGFRKRKKNKKRNLSNFLGDARLGCAYNQRAENGGLDPSWLNLAFLGRPDFQSRGPKTLVLKGFGTSGLKIGAPQKRQIQPPRIRPPILGPVLTILLAHQGCRSRFRPPHLAMAFHRWRRSALLLCTFTDKTKPIETARI